MRTYQDYMRDFAELVASSMALVTEHCRPQSAEVDILEKLREAWSKRIKAVSENDNRRHEVLEKGLGQYFGALVTHVNAIHEKWKRIESDGKNQLIDLDYESDLCRREALEQALKISRAACAYASNLERAESEMLARSLLLAQQLEAYVKRNKILCRSSPYSDCFTYAIHGISAEVRGHGKLVCTFYYWDGVDECYADINLLFTTEEQKVEVRKLAGICLGNIGSLGEDLSTIEMAVVVPLVKP